MEFRNCTPFSALNFKTLNKDDQEYHVVVMKIGYQLVKTSTGHYLAQVMDENIIPLCVQDQYSGELNLSSVIQESDLAPFKPLCDVIVNGSAYAPYGKPSASIPVGIKLTAPDNKVLLNKQLQVTGKREFRKNSVTNKWTLAEAEPITNLCINYQYAFGGQCRVDTQDTYAKDVPEQYQLTEEECANHPEPDNLPIAHTAYYNNPIGIGYIESWYAKATKIDSYPAPQISSIDHQLTEIQFNQLISDSADLTAAEFQPSGFGIIGRGWQSRLVKAGTYDQDWLDQRHPHLPADFNFNYWNGAPQDQQIPYPPANINLSLTNMRPDGALYCQLPNHVAFILLRMHDGTWIPNSMLLDTLIIDSDNLTISITYRYLLTIDAPVRVMEARYETHPDQLLAKIYPGIQVKDSNLEQVEQNNG